MRGGLDQSSVEHAGSTTRSDGANQLGAHINRLVDLVGPLGAGARGANRCHDIHLY
jgi:hypothetical protein